MKQIRDKKGDKKEQRQLRSKESETSELMEKVKENQKEPKESSSESEEETAVNKIIAIDEQVVEKKAVEINLNEILTVMKEMVETQQTSLEAKQGLFEKRIEEQMSTILELI